MKCEVEECNGEAQYALYRTLKGKKEWLQVCKECEIIIGDENMQRAGGRYDGSSIE